MRRCLLVFAGLAALLIGATARAQNRNVSREEAAAVLQPYSGPSESGVDRSTLTGKVMVGYQGWFTASGDGADMGWYHYGRQGEFRPGRCSIDLWPDVSDLASNERYLTPFVHADGSPAAVFSSANRKTVLRHFEWMQQYGIDGVFVQRFVVETQNTNHQRHFNQVLTHCREGANKHGRAYALMYDLSGMRAGGIERAIDDWKLLVDRMRLSRDENDHAYLHHSGKPLVAVWGIGFSDGRAYSLAECDRLIEFLKNDPTYGGNTVMIGIPTAWRTLDRDAVADTALHATLLKADILSPWTVGRYDSPRGIEQHARERWQPDLAWCREHGKEYLPVVFPGFSWSNLKPGAKLDQIPRRKGDFLWRQITAAKQAGGTMVYVAMFDELDEGTAIFKCTDSPPVGASRFLTMAGLPSDHYLWLTGQGAKMLRGQIPVTSAQPERK
jgi:hypothetical protein